MPHFIGNVQESLGSIIIPIEIGVSSARRTALESLGKPVPEVQHVHALVDTGASCTGVDRFLIEFLDLTPTGKISVHTPTSGSEPQGLDQFDVCLRIGRNDKQDGLFVPNVAVIGGRFHPQGFDVLLGRDVLEHSLLIYDGVNGHFSLAF